MYRPVKTFGDTLPVPQLLFSKLTIPGSDDGRFKVALYVLSSGGGEAAGIAAALGMSRAKVEQALNYWEGAGLLVQEAAAPPVPLAPKRRMTTGEVVRAGKADPTLGAMLDELQRLFGTVIGEGDVNVFVSLYVQDGYTADLILLAASEAVANDARRARYVDKILSSWRQAGITDCAAADAYLKLQAERAKREKKLAKHMGFAGGDPFSFADKKKIALWFEDYGYDMEMIDLARLTAGDKGGDVKYLNAILKKWYANGYHTPRDVQQAGEGANMRAMRTDGPTRSDPLMDAANYVPLKKRGGK